MRYFLIGMPLGHSHSPFVHSFFGYEYGLKALKAEELADFFNKRDFNGINITIPYKLTSLQYLDETDASVAECGAVNTVINSNGRLIGYNTDIDGMNFAISHAGITLTGRRVVILGTGGTSNTAQALCRRKKADKITVVGRRSAINYENIYDLADTQIIINTTPVGMYPDNGVAPVDLSRFHQLEGVFDAIYNPIKTRLVLEAEKRGIKCAGGINMLVGQAKRGAELFTGLSFGDDIIPEISEKLIKKLSNISLIGMPGSGKTTIGRLLAQKLNRELLDTDEMIVAKENRSIPEIFDTDGEVYFRKIEKEVIAEATKKQGVIIATGGGSVLDRDNRLNFRQNGLCVRIDRELKDLATDGRPLSASADALLKIKAAREPLYLSAAHLTVKNEDIETAVNTVIDFFENNLV